MRILYFQQIADSRFGEDKASLIVRVKEILENLGNLPGVVADAGGFTHLTFFNSEVTQYRVTFYVRKDRRTTWPQIYRAVNAVCAVKYTLIGG